MNARKLFGGRGGTPNHAEGDYDAPPHHGFPCRPSLGALGLSDLGASRYLAPHKILDPSLFYVKNIYDKCSLSG